MGVPQSTAESYKVFDDGQIYLSQKPHLRDDELAMYWGDVNARVIPAAEIPQYDDNGDGISRSHPIPNDDDRDYALAEMRTFDLWSW